MRHKCFGWLTLNSATVVGLVISGFAQSQPIQTSSAERPIRILAAMKGLGFQGVRATHLEQFAMSTGGFTFVSYESNSGRSGSVVRTTLEGNTVSSHPMSSWDVLDLTVGPSGGADVLVASESSPNNSLIHIGQRQQTSRTPAADSVKLCPIGDTLIGLSASGNLIRLSNMATVATVNPVNNAFEVTCVGVAPSTAVVIDEVSATITTATTPVRRRFPSRFSIADNVQHPLLIYLQSITYNQCKPTMTGVPSTAPDVAIVLTG